MWSTGFQRITLPQCLLRRWCQRLSGLQLHLRSGSCAYIPRLSKPVYWWLCTFLASLLLLLGTSGHVSAQEPTPTETMGWTSLWPTSTPRPRGFCTGIQPQGVGTVTPSTRWNLICGDCVTPSPRPTWTPEPPLGCYSATATVQAGGEPVNCGIDGCTFCDVCPEDPYCQQSITPTPTSEPEMQFYLSDPWYGSVSKKDGWLSEEVYTYQFEIPEGSRVIGLYTIAQRIPETMSHIKTTDAGEPSITHENYVGGSMNGSYCNAGDVDGKVRIDGEIIATENEVCQMVAGMDATSYYQYNRAMSGYAGEVVNAGILVWWHNISETVFAWNVRVILYGIPPEPEQEPTPTPGGGYCSVVEPYDDETENDLGISLPAPIISSARCVELGGWELNTSWIGQGFPSTITLPGIRVCLRGISFGTVNILGTIIDLDYLAYVIAAIAVIMRMIPR